MIYPIALALLLAACNLEESLDNSEPEPITPTRPYKLCAADSTQAADTTNYMRCGVEPKPGTP